MAGRVGIPQLPAPASIPLVLASSSPRRRELLGLLGVTPDEIISPDIDETPRAGEDGPAMVGRLSLEKARAGVEQLGGRQAVVVAADTTIWCEEQILAKPEDAADARRMLTLLSGRDHRVFTGVTALATSSDGVERVAGTVVGTTVAFRSLEPSDIDWYLETGEWVDRAGAYAIQGAGGFLVAEVRGSYHNVVGLPLVELDLVLASLGHPLRSWVDG